MVTSGLALAAHFGDGVLRAGRRRRRASSARSSRTRSQDRVVWLEYLETVVRERDGWKDFYRACREVRSDAALTGAITGVQRARHPPPRAGLGAERCWPALERLRARRAC